MSTDPAAEPPAKTLADAKRLNRLPPLRFVIGFGLVSMMADFVYEGARAVIGPYLDE